LGGTPRAAGVGRSLKLKPRRRRGFFNLGGKNSCWRAGEKRRQPFCRVVAAVQGGGGGKKKTCSVFLRGENRSAGGETEVMLLKKEGGGRNHLTRK